MMVPLFWPEVGLSVSQPEPWLYPTVALQFMMPPATLSTAMYAWLTLKPPENAVRVSPEVEAESLGKYPAWQSPTMLQSDGGEAASNLGTGAVADAVCTVETGANEILSCATAGAVTFGRAMKVGNCALSTALGLASTT